MAIAQFNKELLLKHKFWIFLLVFLILWIVSISILQATATGTIEPKRQAYEKAKRDVEGANKKRPKNDSFLNPWREYGETFANQKDAVWKEAWELQKDMITWPASATAPFDQRWRTSRTLADFFKRLDEETQSTDPRGWRGSLARTEFKDTLYKGQFKDLEVKPVELKGGVEGIFQPVAWGDKPPEIEEVWLAQEDFWVRRELLGVIRSVLEAVGRFERVPLTEKESRPEGGLVRYRFRNASWELDLLVDQQARPMRISPQSRIKNVHVNKRMLKLANPRTNKGLSFRLRQGNNTEPLVVEGEPLAWDQSTQFLKATPVESINLRREFDVEQVFDWHSAPVRRVDALHTAWHSHRTASQPLKAKPMPALRATQDGAAPAPPQGEPVPPLAASPTGPPPGALKGPPPGIMAPGAPFAPGLASAGGPLAAAGGAAAPGGDSAAETTPSGIKRTRYIHFTEQCRHMPVALLLVVDQAHIHDVLIALANCPLRIQITQVAFEHVRGIAPPADEPGRPVQRDGTRFPGPLFAPFPGGVRQGIGERSDVDDPNLVQLAVYGIATLYERFPENRTPPGGGTGTGAAGTSSTGPATNPVGTTPANQAQSPPTGTATPMSPAGKPAAPRPADPKGPAADPKRPAPKEKDIKAGRPDNKS